MPDVNRTRSQADSERKQLAVSATFMAFGTSFSRVLGFLRDILAAAYFSRTATDAWIVAFRIPNLFRRILGEGALSVSFIPVFTDFFKRQDEEGARKLASRVFTLLLLVLTALVVVGTVFAPQFVNAIASGEGFSSVPGKLDLTIHQTRIMFSFILMVSLYAYFMAILNTLRIFWLPAFAPALWNVSMIAFILFGRQSLSNDALAWGTVIGGILQLGILIPALVRRGFLPRIVDFRGDTHVNQVLKAMGPSVFGLSVQQFAVLINTHFAASLEQGSNTWIFYADRVLELPLALFAVSVGTVALPTFSAFWSRGDKQGLTDASLHAFKLVLFVALPTSVGLLLLSHPIIHTLFERGRFTSYDSLQTANVLQVYGFGVIGAAGVRVMAPVFYAMKNTWLPALAAAVALGTHILIAPHLMKLWGIQGLAASSVASGFINLTILLVAYQFLVCPFPWKALAVSVLKLVIACIGLAAGCGLFGYLNAWGGGSRWMGVLALGATIATAAGIYILICWLLRVQEMTETVGTFSGKIKKRLGRR